MATGALLALAGIRLSVASEYEIATAAGVLAPHLDPDLAIAIASLLRVPLLIYGVLRVAAGCKELRWWWLSSPFVWRAAADDEFDFRLEMRPGVRFISKLIIGLLISAVALLVSLLALLCIMFASLGDAELARFVGRFLVDVEFDRHALFISRLVLIAGGIVATTVALNRVRAAELHFEGV
jgi:hypothetical protein